MVEGSWGKVTKILQEEEDIQLVSVLLETGETISAIYYLLDYLRCDLGSIVHVNTSALDLKLGSGGYGFITAIYEDKNRGECPQKQCDKNYPGHIMKVRYTPFQRPILAIEAPESPYHTQFQGSFSLKGKYILIGELHSMLPIVASFLYRRDKEKQLVYIMDDQASLSISVSNHIRELQKKTNLITITYGQAFGGDIEAINLYSALEAAIKVAQADYVFISQGIGVVGTNTNRGFSGMQLAQWVHVVHSLEGRSIVIPRIHSGDARRRHYGVSHHTLSALEHTLAATQIPIPYMDERNELYKLMKQQLLCLQQKMNQKEYPIHELIPIHISHIKLELEEVLKWYNLPIQTMGRDYQQDPFFFYAVASATHYYHKVTQ